MLKKQFRITKNSDFKRIYKKGKTFADSFFVIKIFSNKLDNSRFGFVVGKKAANKIVHRNKIRRQLSEVVRTNFSQIKPEFDVIVIAKAQILGESYQEIEKRLINLLKRARIYKSA
jgi:ribonuclease P protein component